MITTVELKPNYCGRITKKLHELEYQSQYVRQHPEKKKRYRVNESKATLCRAGYVVIDATTMNKVEFLRLIRNAKRDLVDIHYCPELFAPRATASPDPDGPDIIQDDHDNRQEGGDSQ